MIKHLQALLLRLDRDQVGEVFEHLINRKWHRLHTELARFDLGKIENIVDQAKQCVRCLINFVEIIALLRCQLGFLAEIDHADNSVHRGTNFMTHIGQKFTFRLTGRQCRFLSLVKLFGTFFYSRFQLITMLLKLLVSYLQFKHQLIAGFMLNTLSLSLHERFRQLD